MTVLLQARRIQTDSSSYRCNSRIIVHLALKYGQNRIFEKQVKNPPYKTHIRKETEIIVHLALKYGQNKIFEKQEQNPP